VRLRRWLLHAHITQAQVIHYTERRVPTGAWT
jgi:hypothetical protein